MGTLYRRPGSKQWMMWGEAQRGAPQMHRFSLLNSPGLRFVCEEVRSGVDERRNRAGHEVREGKFEVAT